MIKNVLVLMANGTEEIEAVVVIDLLRRAGANVTVVGANDIINCSRDLRILPDIPMHKLNETKLYDLVYLPGGAKGVQNLIDIPKVYDVLDNHISQRKYIAAICAAPTILSVLNLMKTTQKLTSHPSVKEELLNFDYSEEIIVDDNHIITSRGAGTAFEMSFYLIKLLFGEEEMQKIQHAIVWNQK